jgi:ABC-type Na+ efflux pump permease subunit
MRRKESVSMSRRTTGILLGSGLALCLLGIVLIVLAGGWAATGLGTPHSGTPLAVIGTMFATGGPIIMLAAALAAFLVRFNPPR